MKIGFDNDRYLAMQSEHIRERIKKFDNKLYLEFGGKLFDDYHASRVLPGFQPDSKLQMLLQLKEQAEIVIVISAEDIISSKVRGDYGITYDLDVLRLIDAFQEMGLYVGSVCVTKYTAAAEVEAFEKRLSSLGIRTFRHYKIPGYPNDVARIVSDEGYGRNEYIETERPLVVITAPGPGSGKMAVCLSQLYHEYKRGVKAGYAKFETFPIWNIPLKHPVNLAYEAATADLNDVNMIDPFHLEAYGVTTVNYNRDIEIFPVVNAMFELIAGQSPYKSPTDMGVNMAGNCIVDDAVCCEASRKEIVRRYYKCLCEQKITGTAKESERYKLELLMNQAGLTQGSRPAEVCPGNYTIHKTVYHIRGAGAIKNQQKSRSFQQRAFAGKSGAGRNSADYRVSWMPLRVTVSGSGSSSFALARVCLGRASSWTTLPHSSSGMAKKAASRASGSSTSPVTCRNSI